MDKCKVVKYHVEAIFMMMNQVDSSSFDDDSCA